MRNSPFHERVVGKRLNDEAAAGIPLAEQLMGYAKEISEELAAHDRFHREPDGSWAVSNGHWDAWMQSRAAVFLSEQAPAPAPRTRLRGLINRLRRDR